MQQHIRVMSSFSIMTSRFVCVDNSVFFNYGYGQNINGRNGHCISIVKTNLLFNVHSMFVVLY